MGFNLRSLTSSALVTSLDITNQNVANVPTSVERNTSADVERPGEKQGVTGSAKTSIDSHSQDDISEKIDSTAQHGVQQIQAMTYVWTKRDLVAAYIL